MRQGQQRASGRNAPGELKRTLESLGEDASRVARGRDRAVKGTVRLVGVQGGGLESKAANAASSGAAAAGAATEAAGAADGALFPEGIVPDEQVGVVAGSIAADGGGALHGELLAVLVVWVVAVYDGAPALACVPLFGKAA